NGNIHIGHALNKVLKDFIVRYKGMNGFHTPFVPGWDTHGLPIEQALSNSKKVNRKEMSVADFRKLCEEYAYTQVEGQKEQFKRLGVNADWENPYVTLKPEFEAQQITLFGKMAEKGYIYKGLKPVYWSPSSESALAEAEIEYHDKKSPSIYVAFKAKNTHGPLQAGDEVIIWTTTPWTLPANLGISVNPEYTYVRVAVAGRTFVVAEDLLAAVVKEIGWEEYSVIGSFKGKEIDRAVCVHPLYGRDSLLMCGEHVTLDAGTGCVHTAPGHGEDDFAIGKEYGLDVLCPVNDRGVLTDEAGEFAGLFYDDANKAIGMKLEETGALLKIKFITHSYPHDWRTKKPVIYRATAQWFASIKDFRTELLAAVEATEWVPKWGETRLYNMVRDRGDWCISRQRVWGVPIPVFYAENGEEIITPETIAHVSALFREHGSNIWFQKPAKELLPEGFTHPGSPNGEFTKENDIMDVWFDSGSSHQGVLEERTDLTWPADLYLEGSDQYRGWFNSSLTTSVAVTGHAPYKAVVSHGFTLDGEGRKMSKSIGNVIDPAKVMKQLGADILRLWVASVDYQADMRVSDAILKQVAEVYRKIRNTFRFLLGNIDDFKMAENGIEIAQLRDIDQYMIARLNELIVEVKDAYESYDFGRIYHAYHNFLVIDVSSFYLEYGKDILYCEKADSFARRAMQTTIYHMTYALVKLIAPILPHTADEVWSYLGDTDVASVHLTDMPAPLQLENSAALLAKWDAFFEVRDEVNRALEEARNAKMFGKTVMAHVDLYVSEKAENILAEIKQPLHQLFLVASVSVHSASEVPATAKQFDLVAVEVRLAEGGTCERCWNVDQTVGTAAEHPTLCQRCSDVVSQ
ncbi:MAG: isoleucine--tRNA ligase, partial [Bacilli bacterium]